MPVFNVIPSGAVSSVLNDKHAVLRIVRNAYLSHGRGETVNPRSYFLRFPEAAFDRIIALPARIAAEGGNVAGIKWISSFPGNTNRGLSRASAVLILNDMATGYPVACLEGAAISAARTAAGAALVLGAVGATHPPDGTVAVFGAGVIAQTVLDYLVTCGQKIDNLLVCDPDNRAATALLARAAAFGVEGAVAAPGRLLEAQVVITATTALAPHIAVAPGAGQVFLNISLRDFQPEALLPVQNIVDDVDHCLTADTSPHLAEQMSGGRTFITGTIPQLLDNKLKLDGSGVVISPFGLGVLDVALGDWVHRAAVAARLNVEVPQFFGPSGR